jgi:hypothetical protein
MMAQPKSKQPDPAPAPAPQQAGSETPKQKPVFKDFASI